VSERRTAAYILGIAFLALLLVLAAYLGRSSLELSASESAWTKQNEIVLSSLPLYPGATESRAPYSTGEPFPNAAPAAAKSGPFRGYWTTHNYKLPIGVRPDLVLGYYSQQLVGWSSQAVQGTTCEILFRSERVLLELKACDDALTLSVNYREFDG
jgi:hypothetical protein